MSLSDRLFAAPVVVSTRRALGGGEDAWIVGGAVRDAALGSAVTDLDLAVAGGPAAAAKAIAREAGVHAFELSAEFGTWRVVGADRSWQVDVTGLRGATIDDDLAARDFTVGAVAVPLAGASHSTPTAALPISSAASSARSAPAASPTTRCACCAPRGWRPSSTSPLTPGR